MPPAAGEAAESSYPQRPRVEACTLRITLQGHGPESAILFSCTCFTHPWVLGMMVPEDSPDSAPGHPYLVRLRESLTLVPGYLQNGRFKETSPTNLLGSQPHRHPPVLTGHWRLVHRGAEKDEEEAISPFPTYPRLGRWEGHTTALTTTSILLGLQWWYWEVQGGKGAPEKPPRALNSSASS